MYRRYAIYVTPEGPLAQVGASWLGWDIAHAQRVPPPQIDGLDIEKITSRPRKYGLHATVKPPMVLADGTTAEQLITATGQIARNLRPVPLDGLKVTRIGRFLALTPLGTTKPLNAMAAQVVEALDPFRAPPAPEELARRRKSPLTATQEDNLIRWGYPHVMDDYLFHITLTGPLRDVEATLPTVAAHFAPVLPSPYLIDHLTIAGENTDGMFCTIARLPMGG